MQTGRRSRRASFVINLCPVPYALCPMPCALCPMPCALCPMPCALRPVPCALSPPDEEVGTTLCPAPFNGKSCPDVSDKGTGRWGDMGKKERVACEVQEITLPVSPFLPLKIRAPTFNAMLHAPSSVSGALCPEPRALSPLP